MIFSVTTVKLNRKCLYIVKRVRWELVLDVLGVNRVLDSSRVLSLILSFCYCLYRILVSPFENMPVEGLASLNCLLVRMSI